MTLPAPERRISVRDRRNVASVVAKEHAERYARMSRGLEAKKLKTVSSVGEILRDLQVVEEVVFLVGHPGKAEGKGSSRLQPTQRTSSAVMTAGVQRFSALIELGMEPAAEAGFYASRARNRQSMRVVSSVREVADPAAASPG
jgi:hypothetical protein